MMKAVFDADLAAKFFFEKMVQKPQLFYQTMQAFKELAIFILNWKVNFYFKSQWFSFEVLPNRKCNILKLTHCGFGTKINIF